MIQIIEERKKPKLSDRFAQAFSNLGQQLPETLAQYQGLQEKQKQSEALKGIGIDPSLPSDLQKVLLQGDIDYRNKYEGLGELDNENYESVAKAFGPKFASLWKAAPQGGKTELLKHAIDSKQRGMNLEELLTEFEEKTGTKIDQTPMVDSEPEIQEKTPQMKGNNLPKDFEWPDYTKAPKGYTPKQWTDERTTWRKENSEIFAENAKRLKNRKADVLATRKLDQLNKSKNLDKDFARYLINPETGDFYGLAQVAGFKSPEAQEWSKVIARFQNRAKDAFGSRVTNFDLQSYMQQFPGLLNSEEGRQRIIDMMKVNFKLDNLYDNALDKIYKKYGLNGIPREEADRLASSMIEEETERLENEFLGLENENMQLESDGNNQAKLTGVMVDVIGPDGQEYEIDESELNQLPPGFKRK